MQTLLAALGAILSALLRTYLEQRGHVIEIEEKTRLQEALRYHEAGNRALRWKIGAMADRDVSDDLRVRDPVSEIRLPGGGADPGGASDRPPL